jgi:hypothetical protein
MKWFRRTTRGTKTFSFSRDMTQEELRETEARMDEAFDKMREAFSKMDEAFDIAFRKS